ncbi:nucleotidyltransferase family protein [Tabrizicola thermarum]|uniref:nucleotidyltransferase family protein n=1 Tax=Tabrizicola thermarum TaxID=2670345 RepID=UPI000FFCBFF1|nr:nucleotidyltransferase family protein [Tabrizicola thermarum]
MRPTVHILILAAGASSRMRGVDKLVQPIGGTPILRRVTETALATGSPVTIALPPEAEARREVLHGLTVGTIEVPDAQLGMSRSLVRGVAAVSTAADGTEDGLMVLPADMPGFTPAALTRLVDRFQDSPQRIWRGSTEDGRAGHPIIFPRDLWPDLACVTGDEGGRSVLRAHQERVSALTLPGQMAILDLDTPEDWAAYLGHLP